MAVGRVAPSPRFTQRRSGVKLLIVTPWPLSTAGGGQRLARGVGHALAAYHGFDVVVAAGSGLMTTETPVVDAQRCFCEVRAPLMRTSDAAGGANPESFINAAVDRDRSRRKSCGARRHSAGKTLRSASDRAWGWGSPRDWTAWRYAVAAFFRRAQPDFRSEWSRSTSQFMTHPSKAPPLHASSYLEGLEALADQMRPDAILYLPHDSPCARQAAALAGRLGIPFVLWPAIHFDVRSQTNRAARCFYRSATWLACLSTRERRWLVERAGVSADRTLMLGCGWNASAARLVRRRAEGGSLSLLTVSAYADHKQIDHQIEAVSILRREFGIDARLTVAGAIGERVVYDRLAGSIHRARLNDSIELVTDCSDAAIGELHSAADYFLFTSRSESYSLALFEAIAIGTFPIAYPHPAYRELIETSRFGFVTTRSDSRSLAEAIARVSQLPPQKSDESRLRWLADRSWQRVTEPLARALRECSLMRPAPRLGQPRFSPTATIR